MCAGLSRAVRWDRKSHSSICLLVSPAAATRSISRSSVSTVAGKAPSVRAVVPDVTCKPAAGAVDRQQCETVRATRRAAAKIG